MLSGFVLTLSTVRNGPTNAIWQYAQVWPLHIAGLLLAVLSFAPFNPVDLALAVTMMHAWVTPFHSDINGPSWYLSTLLFFWIFVPVWVRMADTAAHRGIAAVIACLVFVWICTLVLPIGLSFEQPEVRNFVEYSPYANWQPFCSGVLLACLAMLQVEPTTPRQVVGAILVASIGLFIAWCLTPIPEPEMGWEYLILDKGVGLQPLFALLVLGCVGSRHVEPNPVHEAITGKFWMHWSARLCWPVFILHQPVHMFCDRILFQWMRNQHRLSYLCAFIYPIALVLTGLIASKIIDQPWAEFLYKFRNKHFKRKDAKKGKQNDPNYKKVYLDNRVGSRNDADYLSTQASNPLNYGSRSVRYDR